MVLVDTSAWIEFFRDGSLAGCIDSLITENKVAVCGPVITELIRGLQTTREKEEIVDLLEGCISLTQPDSLWSDAGEIGSHAAKRGYTVKTMDLLIACYALAHNAALLTTDSDFTHLVTAGIPLRLV